jgi:hypothetical protein
MTDIKKIKPNGDYKSGIYVPLNPEKYIGDIHNIICRSSWEFRFCKYCDSNERILKWSSEPVKIPYYNPLDKKEHNYNVDFYIKVLQDNGSEQEWIIEIKPESQFKKPILEGKNSTLIKLKSYNHKMQVWITNQAKFKAAKLWAEGRGFKFGVVDENFLFRSK